jgi:OmpA-OmpF porin, OOP family
MKQIYTLIVLSLVGISAYSQNLVTNGSFETIQFCPTGQGQVNLATPWTFILSGGGTPDLYNGCNTIGFGVPNNFNGVQLAHTGIGYAGMYAWQYNAREYITIPLNTPLAAGRVYYAEMYVNTTVAMGVGINQMGMYFSTGILVGPNSSTPLNLNAHILDTNTIVADTLNWTLISGNYTAIGGEDFLTIGNFVSDSLTSIIVVNPNGANRSYMLVDDVSVTEITDPDGVHENSNTTALVYPTVLTDLLYVQMNNTENMQLTIYDTAGRVVIQSSFTNQTSVSVAELAAGMYYYELRDQEGIVKNGKLLK